MNRLRDKLALQRFRETCARVADATRAVNQNETAVEKASRITALLADYGRFVAYYFPHYASSQTAKFHVQAANAVLKDPAFTGVFEWARGLAKSTHFDIIMPMWLKAHKQLKVMVLVGKNQDNAITLLSDLQAEFAENERYKADFGEQIKFGSWTEGRFVTQDECAFFALGRGQSPRGLRHRQHRPDYIVLDDVDDDELCRNPDRVRKVVDWCGSALYFATDMGRGRFILVGNRISQTSVLAGLLENKGVYHQKVNALNSSGAPSWPEKYTRPEIERIIEMRGHRASQKELFNNPITEGAVFKHNWILHTQPPPLRQFSRLISYCDPSFKSTATSDYKAIVTLGQKGANLYVLEAFVRKCTIVEMVRWWYNYHEALPPGVICDYYMEANFIQDLIFREFVQEGEHRGYQLPLRPDKRSKPDKFARIEALSPLFERGLIHFAPHLLHNADGIELRRQLLDFEKGSRSADDAPDALEGAVWLINRRSNSSAGSYLVGSRNSRSF